MDGSLPPPPVSSPASEPTLDPQKIRAELTGYDQKQLVAIIKAAQRQYWDGSATDLPDPLYDRVIEALRALNPEHPILNRVEGPADILNQETAAPLDGALLDRSTKERLGEAIVHRRPMLSLEKCYDLESLQTWADKKIEPFWVMPKIDGVACSLHYNAKGELLVAATRGSGSVGEDITHNVLGIPDIPKQLQPAPGDELEIRGEVYMRWSVFSKTYAERFSHPRNLTAGSLKAKESTTGAKAGDLSFYAYDLDQNGVDDAAAMMAALRQWGFHCDRGEVLPGAALAASIEALSGERADLDYEIDGIVVRVASKAQYLELGATGHHPRGAIAYKFQGDSQTTKLLEVQWSVSRTGTITPVAMFESVEVGGARLSRAVLHNLSRLRDLDLHEGDTLQVTRRGGVIPMVEANLSAGQERPATAPAITVPHHCPACQGEVLVRKKRDGEFLVCAYPEQCQSARLRELEHFAKVTDMQGFGPKFLEQAVHAELLSSPADFYRLDLESLCQLERIGQKSAQNLLDEVDKKRSLPLSVFIQALGIEHLGKQNAQRLATAFVSLLALRKASPEEIAALRGFKEAISKALVEGFTARAEVIDALLHHVEVLDETPTQDEPPSEPPGEPQGVLGGKSVLFTGTLSQLTRAQAQALVKTHGGEVAAGVSQKLGFLVVGAQKGGASSKEKKAQALIEKGADLQILSEEDFLQLLPEAIAHKS